MPSNSNEKSLFLKRLAEITEDNLTNSQFGVGELAREFGKSRSHIHLRLKALIGESVSQFIRRIRLEKALEMLQKTEVSVSEIAYNVGFSSPSYFVKCFHDRYGFSPGEFKKQVFGNDSEKDKVTSDPEQFPSKSIIRNKIFKKVLIPVLGIFILAICVFYVYKIFIYPEPPKSIAVLSLKNLSNDENIQHLADGVMEDIRTRLSHLSGLDVKSQISSEKYNDTKLSAREIARELGVSYILEGSIIPDKGKIRINIQLISAKKDNHEWADSFDEDLTGIHAFITKTSRQITEKLKLVLSLEEIKQVEKLYTENPEAYKLYQLGRFFWHRRTNQGFEQSIYYFNQALDLDSTYALAYAGLADAWFMLAGRRSNKCKEYALKAISIDGTLSQPHATLGMIETFYGWDWEHAEDEFKQSIKLNPNNADAYHFYTIYLNTMGKLDEARATINKAIELDPNTKMKYYNKAEVCYNASRFEEVLEALDKMLEFDRTNLKWANAYHIRFIAYVHLGEYSKAFEEYKMYLTTVLHEENSIDRINEIYTRSGIDGILQYEIDRNYTQISKPDHYLIAKHFALLDGCTDSIFAHLGKEILYPTYPRIQYIKTDLDFKFLHGDPRFNSLLKKLNLPVD